MNAVGEGRAPPCLLAAEPAMPQESRSSWIQRLCGAHQYSLARLGLVTGIMRAYGDWDVGVSDSQWSLLVRLADVPVDTCDEASHCLGALVREFSPRRLLLYEKKAPQYRWCSLCMAGDRVPHLRWHWRLIGLSHCLIHDVPLDDRCGWCGSALHLNRSLLVSSGSTTGVPDLATCGSCGMSLCDRSQEEKIDDDANNSFDSSQALMKELVNQLKMATRAESGQMTFDFWRYAGALQRPPNLKAADSALIDSPPARVWVNTCILRLPVPQPPPLLLNGAVFHDNYVLPADTSGAKKKWHQQLRQTDRFRLAVALHSIRQEKNAMRRLPVSYFAAAELKDAL